MRSGDVSTLVTGEMARTDGGRGCRYENLCQGGEQLWALQRVGAGRVVWITMFRRENIKELSFSFSLSLFLRDGLKYSSL